MATTTRRERSNAAKNARKNAIKRANDAKKFAMQIEMLKNKGVKITINR
jgi:hypothetical protein